MMLKQKKTGIFRKCMVLWMVTAALIFCGSRTLAAERADITAQSFADGTVFIPLRQTCEALGYSVGWDNGTYTAYVEINDAQTAYRIDGATALIYNDRTYVELSVFSENHQIYYAQTGADTYSFLTLDAVDAERMYQTIETISETPRVFGGTEIEKTKAYIYDTFKALGYEVDIQEFSYTGYFWIDGTEEGAAVEATTVGSALSGIGKWLLAEPEEEEEWTSNDSAAPASAAAAAADDDWYAREETRTGYNIIARKTPQSYNSTSDIFVIGAHYDSVEGAPGANDNGSGVSALLEIATLIAELPSDTEIRLVAFDGEEDGLIGSYYYVDDLSEDELNRVVGMINFDMFASKDVESVMIATTFGESNYLTEWLDDFELMSEIGSDHSSFFPPAIPSVSFCHDRALYYHSPDDTAEHVDKDKLFAAADGGLSVIAYVMSDATPTLAGYKTSEIDWETVYTIDLGQRILFGSDPAAIEEAYGLKAKQVPTKAAYPMDLSVAYGAMVDWFGEPLETYFEYYGYGGLNLIKVIPDDVRTLKAALDSRYEPIASMEDYSFYIYTDLNIETITSWRNEYGTAFLLVEDGDETCLYITICERNAHYQVEGGTVPELSEKEAEAWEKVKKLLEAAGLLDGPVTLVMCDDGYGGTDFEMYLYDYEPLAPSELNVFLDANDILDEKGTLYESGALEAKFIRSYADTLLYAMNQLDLEIVYDENSDILGWRYIGFKEDSYLMQYANAFGEGEISDDVLFGFYEELHNAFVAYMTGVNNANLSAEKIEFFNKFPEFSELKSYLSS